jgi:hypothetical protein
MVWPGAGRSAIAVAQDVSGQIDAGDGAFAQADAASPLQVIVTVAIVPVSI